MKYCTGCGRPTRAKGPRCRDCQAMYYGEDRFCAVCGAPMRRRDGLCEHCRQRHLDAVEGIADELMG